MRTLVVLALLFGGTAQAADEIQLFNGKDLTGWTFFASPRKPGVKLQISDQANVQPGGILEITPNGMGALITEKDYKDFKLTAEFRWPNKEGGHNDGIFLRVRPPLVWDSGGEGDSAALYQVQISPPSTGDLWVLGGYSETKLKTDPKRSYVPFGERKGNPMRGSMRRHHNIKDAEKPIGEWNTVEIVLEGPNITVKVNGELVNQGTDMADLPGRIGLETESGSIHWRNIKLTPIEKK